MSAPDGAPPRPLVDYLVARTGPPPPGGLAYDYVLGGDGLWVAAENTVLRVRAPIARCRVRGLPPLALRSCWRAIAPNTVATGTAKPTPRA